MRERTPVSSLFRNTRIMVLFLLAALVLPSTFLFQHASGHASLVGANNETLATATQIPDPEKSWAIYSSLHEGAEAQYYKFDMNQGGRIHVMLLKSTRSEDSGFVPSFVLMGPGLTSQGTVPPYVEIPAGASGEVSLGKNPLSATYEAFAPSNFYLLAETSLESPATGTYYVAVFEPSTGGNYGLAVGDRESFTLSEWVQTPFSLLSVYQWEGQILAIVLVPFFLTLAVGMALMLFVRKSLRPKTLYGWTAAVSGLSFIGTSATVLYQAVFSILKATPGAELAVTMIWVIGPTLLGVFALRLSAREPDSIKTRQRLYLAILGGVSLFAWAGLVAGPVIAMAGSLLPSKTTVPAAPADPNTSG